MSLRKPIKGAVEYDYRAEVEAVLGAPGAMLSGSKTAPEGETVYWNACVFDTGGVQIWHGDLNLSRRGGDLQRLADRVGRIYVTPEQPFRFVGLAVGRNRYGDRVVTFDPAPKDTP